MIIMRNNNYVPDSIVEELLQGRHRWTVTNPSVPGETIGSVVLDIAANGDPENVTNVDFPTPMLLDHYSEVMSALAANPNPTHWVTWSSFLEDLPAEKAVENGYAYRMMETQWKHVQRAEHRIGARWYGRRTVFGYAHKFMVKWGIVPDKRFDHVDYFRLPPSMRAPREEVHLTYVVYVFEYLSWISQEYVDLMIEKTIAEEGPTENNLYGLRYIAFDEHAILTRLESGIIFPVIPDTRQMQERLPYLIAWQDGAYRNDRHINVRRAAREFVRHYGTRNAIREADAELPLNKDLMDLVMDYSLGVIPSGQRDRLDADNAVRVAQARAKILAAQEEEEQAELDAAQEEEEQAELYTAEARRGKKRKSTSRRRPRDVRRRK